jgi:hypothetical protein
VEVRPRSKRSGNKQRLTHRLAIGAVSIRPDILEYDRFLGAITRRETYIGGTIPSYIEITATMKEEVRVDIAKDDGDRPLIRPWERKRKSAPFDPLAEEAVLVRPLEDYCVWQQPVFGQPWVDEVWAALDSTVQRQILALADSNLGVWNPNTSGVITPTNLKPCPSSLRTIPPGLKLKKQLRKPVFVADIHLETFFPAVSGAFFDEPLPLPHIDFGRSSADSAGGADRDGLQKRRKFDTSNDLFEILSRRQRPAVRTKTRQCLPVFQPGRRE